jgi:pyruvate/2-oxoglutarate dehydrogenase complex dihydrolipoamide acyltransferase (E2) component
MEIKKVKKMKTKIIKVPSIMDKNGVKIVKWYVKNNDLIIKNQLLVKLDSGAFEMEIESDFDGTIEIILEEGKTGFTNDIICKILES